jgi:hypothetical protein
LNSVRHVHIQFPRRDQPRNKLHDEVPHEGVKPSPPIHTYFSQKGYRDSESSQVCKGGRNDSEQFGIAEGSREQRSPSWYHIAEPNYDAGQRPNCGYSNQFLHAGKQSRRQQQVANVAHPKDVADLPDLPIVNCLGGKKNEREKS